eukprot:403361925
MRMRVCKDPKYLAWATWTILANSPINKSFYFLLQAGEGIIQLFYILMILARSHYSNLKNHVVSDHSSNSNKLPTQNKENSLMGNSTSIGNMSTEVLSNMINYHYDSPGISYKQIRQLDDFLNDFTVPSNNVFWLSLNIGILSLSFILLVAVLIFAIIIKNHEGLQKPNYIKKVISFLMILFMTIFQMPFFDIILRNLMTISDPGVDLTLQIVKYGVSFLTIMLFTLLMVFIVRLFNVCVPSDDIPWCYPVSKIVYLNLLLKGAIVACIVLDKNGSFALIEIICVLILQTFLGGYRLLFSPNYEPTVDFIVKSRDFLNSLALVVGISCQIVADKRNYDLIYMICFAPIVILGWKMIESMRNQQMLVKLKNKTLKLELEYEYILYTLMMLIATTGQETLANQKVFGQLMDIMIVHINECNDQLCICCEMENFYELMRYKYLNNSEVFSLEREERKKFKKIIDDQGLVGTISNITDLVCKAHSTESTVLKANNEMDRQNLQEDADLLNKQNIAEDIRESQNRASNFKKRKRRTYKINIDETKHRFLSELIYLFYFELKMKFPDSFKIQLLSNYFALKYKKKDMLCIFQLRSFNVSKLSVLDQVTFIINEKFLLHQIEIEQKSQQIVSQENGQIYNMNGEYFIQINQLYKSLNVCIESLSACVVNFWKDFKQESINVDKLQKEGIIIAQNIQSTYNCFQELESIKLFKDYQMYFQFAIVQLHILNDQVAYELYVGKMKSILETNKMFEKNFSTEKDSDYSNFVIVDANGQKFGQILQLNKSLRHLLEWNDEDFTKYRIESFMPTLIREKHSQFLDRYNKTGQSFIINNKTCMFVKKSNGYVIPVELYIKFHYSIDYQYVFLAILKPFYEMAPFANGVKYNMDQLIFLVTDSDDGRIYEYSESCKQLLRFSKQYTNDGIIKRVDELINCFNFNTFKKGRQSRYITNDIYEEIHNLEISYLKDVTEVDIDKGIFNLINGQMFDKLTKARTRVFEERYSGGVLDINIFCFLFLNEDDQTQSRLMTQGMTMMQSLAQNQVGQAELDKIKEEENSQSLGEGHDSGSGSVTGSNSTGKTSTTSMIDYRNFHSFSKQATPRSLKIILQLMFILYIIMITVSSINLGINISRQKQSEYDVHVVKDANDRMNLVSINLLLSRVLLNIANGFEANSSILIKDRFEEYKEIQREKIQLLRVAQSNLQQSSFSNSEEISRLMTSDQVLLHYLNEQNQQYSKMENLNIAFNLFIARVADMNAMSIQQMRGGQAIQQIIPNNDPKYRPSIDEQTIFFTIENSNKGFRYDEIMKDYESFLGIKIRNQQIEQIRKDRDQNTNIMNQESRGGGSSDYYTGSYMFGMGGGSTTSSRRLDPNKPREYNNQMMLREADGQNSESQATSKNPNAEANHQVSISLKDINLEYQKANKEKEKRNNKNKHSASKPIIEEEDEQDYNSDNNEKGDYDKDYEHNKNKSNLNNESQRFSSMKTKNGKAQKRNDGDSLDADGSIDSDGSQQKKINLADLVEQTEDDKNKQTKKKTIRQRSYQRRTTMIFLIVSVIVLLSIYFVIAYFLAIKTFEAAMSVIKSLELIFYKGSCFDSTMNFLRENQIRQSVTKLEEMGNISGTDYYLSLCLEKEAAYSQLKMNLPVYFDKAKDLIQTLDSKTMCDTVYTGQYLYLHELCKISLNGILGQGMSNAFYYMYAKILKDNLKVNSNAISKNITFTKQLIKDPEIIQIIDMKAKLLDPTLTALKDKCINSVVTYIQKLLNDFVVAFIVFIMLLTLGLFLILIIGFKKLRKSMWETNILIKIIPFEALSKKDRIKIKDFFNS